MQQIVTSALRRLRNYYNDNTAGTLPSEYAPAHMQRPLHDRPMQSYLSSLYDSSMSVHLFWSQELVRPILGIILDQLDEHLSLLCIANSSCKKLHQIPNFDTRGWKNGNDLMGLDWSRAR